jgi:hypothetical protein
MTLNDILAEKLANWRPEGRQSLIASDAGVPWSAEVTAECVDRVGCRLWELTLRRAGTDLDESALKEWAGRVAGRVTGLLEPLELVEVDAPRRVALVRSAGPGQRGDDLYYYEALFHGDGAVEFRRYQGSHQPGARRQQVAFTLTHDALARLVSDLTAD